MLSFDGSCLLRHHLACSLLSQRAIKISDINADSHEGTGLRPFEANFLKFIQRISSGSKMETQKNNTELCFTPGIIVGGHIAHEVPCVRAVGYIVEVALLLLPFAKFDSEITLTGATHSEFDIAADTLRTVTLRWIQLFGVEAEMRIVRRGAAPNGGGCVVLKVKACRRLRSVDITERGKIRRVRGIAFAARTSVDLPQRAATAAKGKLLNVLPDVYVVTDMTQRKGQADTGSSGYGVTLVAESTSKFCVLSQEAAAGARQAPEEVGELASLLLLEQVMGGGCVDAHHQMLVLLMMAMSPDDVSVARFGALTPSAVSALSLAESYFGVTFAIRDEPSKLGDGYPSSTIATCIGCNLINKALKSG